MPSPLPKRTRATSWSGRTAGLFALALVAGCAAPAAPGPASTAIATTGVGGTAAATAAATSGPPAATAPIQTPLGAQTAMVDLTFTGDISLVAKGSAGDCQLGEDAGGSVIGFGFTATDSDYKGLGDSFNITEDIASHKVSVKWVVAGTFYAGVFASGVTVAPDHHSVTFDADIPAGVGRTEHLKGSITCP